MKKEVKMITDKKGLSTVVTTLIIILLVLVAVGIVWVVIRGVVEEGTESINYTTKCLQVDLRATAVTNPIGTSYDVTLNRGSGGDDIGGVKMVFFSTTASSSVIDSLGNIGPLVTVTKTIDGEISNANKVEVTPYFIDEAGEERLCGGQTYSFSF
jgi:predicted PurR-regulated permease PerM